MIAIQSKTNLIASTVLQFQGQNSHMGCDIHHVQLMPSTLVLIPHGTLLKANCWECGGI